MIPIPKPGKDPTNPTYYRLIALTCCICKTREGMINRSLTNVQCGFRSRRSTIDHLVRFETGNRSFYWRKLMTQHGSMGL